MPASRSGAAGRPSACPARYGSGTRCRLYSASGRRLFQSLLQIGDDVVDRFDPYRQANHVGAGAGGDALLVGELAMGGRGGMDDQAFGSADIGEVGEQLDAVVHLYNDII